MTQTGWWLQFVGLAGSLVAAVMLATSQRPAPDNIHGNIVFLRNPTIWRWGFIALIAGSLLQCAALLLPPVRADARQADKGQSARTTDIVEAQRFILRDSAGRMRAELHARHPSTGVVLDFYNEKTLHIAELSETGLAFWGRGVYAVLETVGDTARLVLKTQSPWGVEKFTTRAELTVTAQGSAKILLHGEDGKIIWKAP